MTLQRIAKRMLNCCRVLLRARARSLVFSALAFGATLVTLYEDSFVFSSNSLRSLSSNGETPRLIRGATHETEARILESTFKHLQLRSVHEEVIEIQEVKVDDDEYENIRPLVPPINVTEEERVSWFRKVLPEFDIFQSNNLTRPFHVRVTGFFGRKNNCSVQFFMTWISPARSFGRREFLALESLFKSNPYGCLVIISRTMDSKLGFKKFKPVLGHGFKVIAVTPDLPFLFKNTPAKAWFDEMKAGTKDPGEIPLAQNLSNLIRIAILFKYGGVYLDTDVIVLKDFAGLRNSIGAQSVDAVSRRWTRLNNAVMVFDKNHPLLLKFMMEFASTFDGNKWGHNGPYLVSRVVEKVNGKGGFEFKVLPPMAFYPVDWTRIGGLFRWPQTRAEAKWVEAKITQLSGGTYGVHLWNKQSRRLKIEEGSVIGRLIEDHCVICEKIYD
ncbi:uncharacterized protein LOC115672300 [Syzygium oleosum]|uniref:uncharacterized protein LOC115672300 n=1 Tax=Syzygium oleosum TaxID=219896 RepID=UPI0011D2C3CD|nr:uncharacterized protein LOC115672300 [Syzygium oleosum]